MSDLFSAADEKKIDLSVNIAGVFFKNPVIAASGTFGCGKDYRHFFDLSIPGGICTKGLTINPRPGNSGVRIWETAGGLLNSIGLENPGIPAFIENELPYLKKFDTVIIANLSGASSDEYIDGATLLNESSADMVELNISCPNIKEGGMAFGLNPGTAAAITAAVRHVLTNKPLMVKLSPNAPSIASVAVACVKAGADALSLVNSFKAMAIDTAARKPVFDNVTAGFCGPAIKPIALGIVWELFDSLKEAKTQVPIVGIGGIACANDALEFLMAGAAAVQVGSASFENPHAIPQIINGIGDYMIANKIPQISGISIKK